MQQNQADITVIGTGAQRAVVTPIICEKRLVEVDAAGLNSGPGFFRILAESIDAALFAQIAGARIEGKSLIETSMPEIFLEC